MHQQARGQEKIAFPLPGTSHALPNLLPVPQGSNIYTALPPPFVLPLCQCAVLAGEF